MPLHQPSLVSDAPAPMRESPDPMRETTASAAGEARFAGAPWQVWARSAAIGAAAGLFLAVIGAAGTAEAPLLRRLLYWVPMMTLGVFLGGWVASVATRLLPARANVVLLWAVVTLGVAVVSGALIFFYTGAYWGFRAGWREVPTFALVFLAISAAMTALMIAVTRPGAVTHAPAAGVAATGPRLAERFPAKLKGAALYAVSAEDHYLRLHTSKGADLILMRLSDAIAELEGVEGAQTHRSWWVAREAVEDARREGERVTLVLKGGAEAPVSRPNVRALREAGWF